MISNLCCTDFLCFHRYVLAGGNLTCFAYGQTGSGKTYTMTAVSDLVMDNLFSAGACAVYERNLPPCSSGSGGAQQLVQPECLQMDPLENHFLERSCLHDCRSMKSTWERFMTCFTTANSCACSRTPRFVIVSVQHLHGNDCCRVQPLMCCAIVLMIRNSAQRHDQGTQSSFCLGH